MGKLKLYDETDTSREQLYNDLMESFDKFRAYPVVSEVQEQIKAYIGTEEGLSAQLARFNKFAAQFERLLTENGKNTVTDRAERDLLKYRYLSFIKSNVIQQIENSVKNYNVVSCAEQSVDENLKDVACNEAKLNKFLDEAKLCSKSVVGNERKIKCIEKLHEETLEAFTNLTKSFPSKENSDLSTQIQKEHKFQGHDNTNIGKRTWKDFFGDVMETITSIASSIISLIPQKKTEEYKGSFFGEEGALPPKPSNPAPSAPPIPPNSELDVLPPDYPPPPVPTVTFAQKVEKKKNEQEAPGRNIV